jgi:hypothetical protein
MARSWRSSCPTHPAPASSSNHLGYPDSGGSLWPGTTPNNSARVSFVCAASDELTPQDTGDIRRCGRCDKDVHPARTAAEFDALARRGVCIYTCDTDAALLVSVPGGPPQPVKGTPPHQATAGIPFNPDAQPIPCPEMTPPRPPLRRSRKLLMGGVLAFVGVCLLLGVALGAVLRLLLG